MGAKQMTTTLTFDTKTTILDVMTALAIKREELMSTHNVSNAVMTYKDGQACFTLQCVERK
jgi:predicted site-specific integrase-resolvase